jgi:hypothetical protein
MFLTYKHIVLSSHICACTDHITRARLIWGESELTRLSHMFLYEGIG